MEAQMQAAKLMLELTRRMLPAGCAWDVALMQLHEERLPFLPFSYAVPTVIELDPDIFFQP